MLTSAQIIARSQAEVSSKLNALLQYLPDAPTLFSVEVAPFGSNQFVILVTWNVTAGLRAFVQGAAQGLLASVTKLHSKTPFKPLLGLKAAVSFLFNELYTLTPLVGLKVSRTKLLTKNPRPLIGVKSVLGKVKQTPTRMKPLIGLIVTMAITKITFVLKPSPLLGLKAGFGQILKNGIQIMPW